MKNSSRVDFRIPALLLCALAGVSRAQTGPDLAGMDRSIRPGNDFFAYANGTWLKETPIPPDRSSYGVDAVLAETVDKQNADLIQKTASQSGGEIPDSEAKKIADFYASYLDTAAIEAKGGEPLAAGLKRIAGIRDRQQLAAEFGAEMRADVDVLNATEMHTANLFGLWVAADLEDPTRYVPFLIQGGLSLPDREYYVADSPKMADTRARFQDYIEKTLTVAGIADAKQKAARIFALEMTVARKHWSLADSEEVAKRDSHWTRQRLEQDAPGIDWSAYLTAAHLENAPVFIIWQPSALVAESALVASTPLADWKDYLAFHYIDRNAELLSKVFVDVHFEFHNKVLQGTPEQRPRWKLAIAATNNAMGEAVGKLYVAEHFPPQSKAAIQDLVKNLIAAFDRRIDALSWMSPQTKTKARAKLRTLKVGVGYPDHWRNFAGLKVIRGDAFGNAQRASVFDTRQKIERLGKPVDRGEWVMNPQLVDAVNLPVLNALNFPAAILQSSYFDVHKSAAFNYGAIGATIGHEISHSFDSDGAQFDASGKLHNWWTKDDLAHFKAATQLLVHQYDGYRPFPDLAVNGTQTLDENIADEAGLTVALDAYHLSLHGTAAPVVDGFNGDQQFFIAFAQSWRGKEREPALRILLASDGHAPDQYRAQTVRNLSPWYDAFNVKPTDALYLAPEQRAQIW